VLSNKLKNSNGFFKNPVNWKKLECFQISKFICFKMIWSSPSYKQFNVSNFVKQSRLCKFSKNYAAKKLEHFKICNCGKLQKKSFKNYVFQKSNTFFCWIFEVISSLLRRSVFLHHSFLLNRRVVLMKLCILFAVITPYLF